MPLPGGRLPSPAIGWYKANGKPTATPMSSTAPSSATVLLADRAEDPCQALAAGLAAAGYQVEAAPNDAALHELLERDWDVVILDIDVAGALPRSDGGAWQPLCILLADALTPEGLIAALRNFGADACLERPVHIGVLVATIASLRRRLAHVSPPPQAHREAPRGGEENNVWKLSPTQWTITCPRGQAAKLTRAETDFLLLLARTPGAAVPREHLIAGMGHSPDYYDSRRLDTFVSRLRSKVSNTCASSPPLRSVHAVGYAFAAPLLLVD